MEGRHQRYPVVVVKPPPKPRDRLLGCEKRLCGEGPKGDDDFRTDGAELFQEERLARLDLRRKRISVAGGTTFKDVADVDVVAAETHRLDDPGEELPRLADEGYSLEVLVPPRCLADEDDPRLRVSGPKDERGPGRAESAAGASFQFRPESIEALPRRHFRLRSPIVGRRGHSDGGGDRTSHRGEGKGVDAGLPELLQVSPECPYRVVRRISVGGKPLYISFLILYSIHMPVFILVFLAALLFIPSDAFAWGAGIHLQLGLEVLDDLRLLQPAVALLLQEYPYDFLYGCIAADITVGKRFTHYLQHCHRWDVGFRVLRSAETRAQQACAYGYLSHLAADTVAHNYYVPYKLMLSFPTLTLKHTYWEMRFETFADRDVWEVGRKISQEHYRPNDALLRRVLSDTIFSFGTNKRIFNSILLVSRLEKWQQVLRTLTNSRRYALSDTDRDDYLDFAREAVADFLGGMEDSRFFSADPTGEKAIELAEAVRRRYRVLYLSRRITRKEALGELLEIKGRLREAMFEPERLPEIVSAEKPRRQRKKRGQILI
jgi:hypothetical protein